MRFAGEQGAANAAALWSPNSFPYLSFPSSSIAFQSFDIIGNILIDKGPRREGIITSVPLLACPLAGRGSPSALCFINARTYFSPEMEHFPKGLCPCGAP